ncbi:MAG: polysaccharide biosynthesis protein [Clostridia bacterium]|nr:polysaccharide biosynthesis protein [Clostridia bacterium]
MKRIVCDNGHGGADRRSERTFMSGVLTLSLSTIIVKIIGLVYKIPLLSVLGAEGMGYFNSAYEIYALLCGISTSGLPIAVSMLISSAREMGDSARVGRVFRTSSALLVTKGVLVSGGLAVFAAPVAKAVGNTDAYLAILAISPALLFSCVSGAVRGYFQGCRNMTPTAVCQLLEAVGKLAFGVAFAALAVSMGMSIPTAAALAVLGVSVGSMAAAVFLVIRKRVETGGSMKTESRRRAGGHCVLELLKISLPITLGSALMGSTRIIDMALIMRRLGDIGVSSARANVVYGSYTTLAMPIYSLIPAFIPPITESLIPRLSAAVQSGEADEQGRAVSNSMRLTVFLAVPASMGIALYSEQILRILFGDQSEAIAIAAPLLSVLGASVLFSCMITTTTAILQSYRRVIIPILSLAAGAAVKAVSAYFLIGDPDIGTMGAPISTLLFNITVLVFNLGAIYKIVPRSSAVLRQLPKPFFAALVAMLASYAVYLPLSNMTESNLLSFGAALATAVTVYFLLAVLLGVVNKDDIAVFGRGKNTE